MSVHKYGDIPAEAQSLCGHRITFLHSAVPQWDLVPVLPTYLLRVYLSEYLHPKTILESV